MKLHPLELPNTKEDVYWNVGTERLLPFVTVLHKPWSEEDESIKAIVVAGGIFWCKKPELSIMDDHRHSDEFADNLFNNKYYCRRRCCCQQLFSTRWTGFLRARKYGKERGMSTIDLRISIHGPISGNENLTIYIGLHPCLLATGVPCWFPLSELRLIKLITAVHPRRWTLYL